MLLLCSPVRFQEWLVEPMAQPNDTMMMIPLAHHFPYDTGSMLRRDVWASRERMHP